MSTELALPISSSEDTFCLAIIEYGGNLGAAYRAAFGSHTTNGVARARELLLRPEIAKRVQQLGQSVEEHALISLGSHLVKLAEIRDLAIETEQLKVAVQAEIKRGEVAGFYKDKVADPGARSPSVNVFIGSSPSNVNDWAAIHGKAPVIIENGS